MNSFINDFFSVGLSKILMIIAGLGTSIITARYLGPEGNGTIAALLVYPSLFMTIGSLGLRQSTTYFIGKGIYKEEQIKVAITQIWFLSSLFALVVNFILISYFSRSGENLLWVILALTPIPLSLFNTYNSGIFLGKNDIQTFNKINWIPSVIILFATLFFVMLFQFGITGAMIALIFGPFFMFFFLLFRNKFIQSFSLQFNWKIIKAMLSLGITYAIALLVINLNYKIDIILLDRLSTPYNLGIYTKGSNITQYLWQIPMLFSTIVFARSSVSKDGLKFSYKVSQLLRVSFIFIGSASIFLLIFSEIIIVGMYGESFRGSIKVLNYLLPGVLLLTIFKVMNMDLAGKGKPWISMKAMVPALGVNIILNFILIPSNGAYGAAIASTVSYTIAGLLFLWFYSTATNIPVIKILAFKKTDFEPVKEAVLKIINK